MDDGMIKPKTISKSASAILTFIAFTAVGIAPANASGFRDHIRGRGHAHPHEDDDTACFSMQGSLDVSFVSTGCASPVGMCTRGVYRSSFISGTTSFQATGIGGLPVGESSIVTPPAEPGTTWSYSGDLTITTRLGTLSFRDVGVLDTAAGSFTELARPVSGTGAFVGMTGNVYVSGTVTESGDGFTGTVSGRLCVPTAAH